MALTRMKGELWIWHNEKLCDLYRPSLVADNEI